MADGRIDLVIRQIAGRVRRGALLIQADGAVEVVPLQCHSVEAAKEKAVAAAKRRGMRGFYLEGRGILI
jgi:hypothetical protein